MEVGEGFGVFTTKVVFEEEVFAGEFVADGGEEGFAIAEVGDFELGKIALIDLEFVDEGGGGVGEVWVAVEELAVGRFGCAVDLVVEGGEGDGLGVDPELKAAGAARAIV